MIESQGTTPEFQGNPESGVDQLLNRTAKPTYEELEASITSLATQLDTASNRIQQLESRVTLVQGYADTAQEVVTKAREMFQEILAGDMDPEGTIEEFRAPFELLGVEFTQEVEVEITATWTVTVTKPFGYELDGHNDFTCDINSDSNEVTLHDSWHTPEVEVREL